MGRPSPGTYSFAVQSGSDLTMLAARRRKLADQALALLAAAVVFGAVAADGRYRVFAGLVALVSVGGWTLAPDRSRLYQSSGRHNGRKIHSGVRRLQQVANLFGEKSDSLVMSIDIPDRLCYAHT